MRTPSPAPLALVACALAAPVAHAETLVKSKLQGKALVALFEQQISSCPARDGSGETWRGVLGAQVTYAQTELKSSGAVAYEDVDVLVWRSDPCGELPEFIAGGCTTFGGPDKCWTDPVYTSKSVSVDGRLRAGRVVAIVPLYGVSDGCGYSAEVSLDWTATADRRIKWNGVAHYYGFEVLDGPLVRYGAHSQATVQPATASGTIRIGGWRNLDGSLAATETPSGPTTDPCGSIATFPANWAARNVLWDPYDPDRVAPWTSIQERYDTEFRRIVGNVPPRGR